MKSDKDLIREGRYQEALGKNYSPNPYNVIDMTNQSNPITESEFYTDFEEAKQRAIELRLTDYVIFNLNADWL